MEIEENHKKSSGFSLQKPDDRALFEKLFPEKNVDINVDNKMYWWGWGVRYGIGLAIGILWGIISASYFGYVENHHDIWISMMIAGAALLTGGMFIFVEERMWWGRFFRLIPPTEMRIVTSQALVAILSVSSGIVLLVVSFLKMNQMI